MQKNEHQLLHPDAAKEYITDEDSKGCILSVFYVEEMADPYVAMDATVYGVVLWLLQKEAPQEEADM